MSIVIGILLLVISAGLWNEYRKGHFFGKTNWFVTLLLYGVNNHSSLGLFILLAVMIFCKLWFLALCSIVMWLTYVAIERGIKAKKEGEKANG